MTELNKFRVLGLLHFHKEILPSHEAGFPFQKLQYAYDTIYCIREKKLYIDTKCNDKEFM